MDSNRMIGFALLIGGLLVGVIGLAWGLTSLSEGNSMGGFLLWLLILLLMVVPLMGAGAYVLRRAGGEMAQMVEVKRQKKILGALQAQGRLSLSEAAIEVDATRDQIQQDIYDLVGKGLFSGYIDWDNGILYSRQARDMRNAGVCPNCGAQLELAGKGVTKCPYCGTEIFL